MPSTDLGLHKRFAFLLTLICIMPHTARKNKTFLNTRCVNSAFLLKTAAAAWTCFCGIMLLPLALWTRLDYAEKRCRLYTYSAEE